MRAVDLVTQALGNLAGKGTLVDVAQEISENAPPCFRPDMGAIEAALSEAIDRGEVEAYQFENEIAEQVSTLYVLTRK